MTSPPALQFWGRHFYARGCPAGAWGVDLKSAPSYLNIGGAKQNPPFTGGWLS